MSYVAALHLYPIKLGPKLIQSLHLPWLGQGRSLYKGEREGGGGYPNCAPQGHRISVPHHWGVVHSTAEGPRGRTQRSGRKAQHRNQNRADLMPGAHGHAPAVRAPDSRGFVVGAAPDHIPMSRHAPHVAFVADKSLQSAIAGLRLWNGRRIDPPRRFTLRTEQIHRSRPVRCLCTSSRCTSLPTNWYTGARGGTTHKRCARNAPS